VSDRRESLLLREARPPLGAGAVLAVGGVAAATALLYGLRDIAPVTSLGVVYLLVVSAYWGAAPVPQRHDPAGGHEQRAAAEGIPTDARISRGRTFRDALRRELEGERFDRVIISTGQHPGSGFTGHL
jgi:hypothetical protein